MLISGAAGFLGRNLTARLTGVGVNVYALTRLVSGLGVFDGLPRRPEVLVHNGETESLVGLVQDAAPDVVIHLAGLYVGRHGPEHVEQLLRDNVLFGTQLLEACARARVKRFVNTGSYVQFMDGQNGRTLNLYAAAKEAFEVVLAYYADTADIEALTLVLYDTYGPGDQRGKLLEAIVKAQKSGESLPLPAEDTTLDLVHVNDVCAAFVKAAELLESDPAGVKGRRFAVTSGNRVALSDIIDLFDEIGETPVRREWGKYPPPERSISFPWEGPTLPGWRAEVDLREGVRQMIKGTF